MRLLYLTLPLIFHATYALPRDKRALDGVFEPVGPLEETHGDHPAQHTTVPLATTHPASATATSSRILPELLSSLQKTTQTKTDATTTGTLSHTTANAFQTHSIIGSISPGPVYTSSWSPKPIPTTTSVSVPSAPPTFTPPTSSREAVSEGSKEWKIIGVAVIAFSTVAAILLLSVFFDQWWGFIRDLVWKKKKEEGAEEFIPDWKKASWHMTLHSDQHRYPSLLPPARTRSSQQDLEKVALQESMVGVGSGFGKNLYESYPKHDKWASGLGILTPIPPAHHPNQSSQLPTQPSVPHATYEPSLHRSRSRQLASPAFTDPYGGIE